MRRNRITSAVAIAALGSVMLAVWVASASWRERQFLKHASLSQLQRAAAQQPYDAAVYRYLGIKQRAEGDAAAAARSFQHAATIDPNDEESWLGWSSATAQVTGTRDATAILMLYLTRHGRSSRGHLALARLYHRNNLTSAAAAEAVRAYRLDPALSDAALLAAEDLNKEHAYEESQSILTAAIKAHPDDWRLQQAMGDLLFEENLVPDSIPFYTRAVRLRPREGVALLGLGRALLTAGGTQQVQQSLSVLQSAEAIMPADPRVWLALGQSLALNGRPADARTQLDRAEAAAPQSLIVHYQLARVDLQLGDRAASAKEAQLHESLLALHNQRVTLTGLVNAQPRDASLWLRLAQVCDRQRDITAARAACADALAIAPHLGAAISLSRSLNRLPPVETNKGD
ncbi:MAG: tetratricopeptide repeat protein [Armatimonadetes bacterium]|nr:tetratricopeptide repeat protein [Armatimonadota bacterium]MDE2207390.1 tetratricopeptide repeat protein [Armatimonadota bacterium]